MRARHLALGILTALAAASASCTAGSADPPLPDIVAQSIEFHGGDLYEGSTIRMTITSLCRAAFRSRRRATAASTSMWSSIPAPTAGPSAGCG